jgi:spore germination protein KA
MEATIIAKTLDENEKFLKNKIGESFDTNYRRFIISACNNKTALIVYISGLVNTTTLNEYILTPLMTLKQSPTGNNFTDASEPIPWLMNSGVSLSGARESNQWSDICDSIMEGNSILFIEDCDKALILSTNQWESRTTQEPVNESEPRGPRDGFIEDIQTNTAMIRRRIKDHNLRFETIYMGERTKTKVCMAYIDNIVNKSILQEVRTRLNRIKIDAILDTGFIEELISDSPNTIFPLYQRTERPDKTCAVILDGRIAILVDTTPFVLLVPSVFWQYIHASGDYYEKPLIGSFLRVIRLLALFLSLSLSSFYVLLMSYHQEMIPTSLALKLAVGREGVPFPIPIEVFTMELALVMMKEAGVRMPTSIGQTVSFLGAVVIGQSAVAAGFIGPATVIVVALSTICSYAIPSLAMTNTITIIRLPLLLLTSTFGLLGYLAGIIVIVLHLMSLRSFGAPYLAPISPYDKDSNKDTIIRAPLWRMHKRSSVSKSSNLNRQKNDMKPQPPKEN